MIGAAALVAVLAAAFGARLAFRRARAPRLPAPLGDPPAVAVLLPVRDEADNVEPCLATLLAQSTPVEILVLDDGSTDATRALVERVAAADPRVEVVSVPTPPAGQSGKVNALCFGLERLGQQARSSIEWVLTLDADSRPGPQALARALAAARGNELAAISLAARQCTGSAGEALLTPLVFALLDALLGSWRRAAIGETVGTANGQFFLFNRTSLLLVGGFEAIRGEPLDDVALARRLAAAGFRVGFWRAREALEVRMYRGLAATFRGWRRNLALILGARRLPLAASVAAALAPALVAAAAVATGNGRAALLAWAGGALASLLARAGTGSAPLWGLLYPLDALILSGCLVAAARDRRRGRLADWRGRELSTGG
ncbi:MAG: glycosyl transferase family 2 [Acidobacteria bacterium]|nr:glycosyl transferase family 2 [Acidobacteriota bacterium]